jgi:DNA-binding response OmpR family regulator
VTLVPRSLLVYPSPPPPELAQALDLAGHQWKAIDQADEVTTQAPDDGWGAAVLCADEDPTGAFSVARSIRRVDSAVSILILLGGAQLVELDHRDELFDDFCLTPFQPRELEARLSHQLAATGSEVGPDLIEHGELVLNLETYQAAVSGNSLDLTYMEYELLKFLASNPGKVFTRETLLSRVWGYDYYGGARTVDVHVRRLRAKLGEEHASYIHTVRSVGYRFGQSRWDAG